MLSKLSIQGVRSFGADHDEKLEFFSPLTLILGQNGTGKTTIIECLKYITTGVFPPGTKGAAFVHDPKLDRSSEVKGQIKLQFKGGTNNLDCMVHRSMAVTMKGSKANFKSIDGYLRVKEPGKEPKTISMKCGDLDHEMCSLLGVSKPVLENVIFCHQEDSNWPLGEGKALKQKFDDIFASGRYAKALDTMLKLQKENLQEINVFKAELKYLKEKKDKAAGIRSKIEDLQTQLTRTDSALEELERNLKPIQDELKRLEEVEKQAYAVQSELGTVSANWQVITTQVGDLERVCPPERSRASGDDLRAELERLKNRSDDWRSESDRLTRKRADLSRKLEMLQQEKQKNAVRERELELVNRQLEDKKALKSKLANQINELLGQSSSQEFENTQGLRRLVGEEISRLQMKKSAMTEQFDREEEAVEKELNAANGRKAYLENSLREKEREKLRFEADLKRLAAELQDVNSSQARARQLAADIVDAERKLASAEAASNLAESEAEYNELMGQKAKVTQEQQQLTQQLSRAHKAVEVEAKIGFLNRDKSSKEERADELERNIRNRLSLHTQLGADSSFESVDRGALHSALEAKRSSLKSSLTTSERDLEASQRHLAGVDGNLESSKRRFAETNKELEKTRSRITSLLTQFGEHGIESQSDLDAKVKDVQETLESLQNEFTTNSSNESMMKGYIEVIEKPQPQGGRRSGAQSSACGHSSCPLCERPFSNESERTRVVTSIKSRLSSALPEKQAELKREISSTKSKLDGLRALRPIFGDRTRLEGEVGKLKAGIDDSQVQSERLRRETEALRQKVARERDQLTEITSLITEAAALKQLSSELVDIEERIGQAEQEQALIFGAASSRASSSTVGGTNLSAAQLSSRLERKALEMRNIEEQLELCQRRMKEDREMIESCRERLLKLRQDKIEIDSKQQKRCQLEADRDRTEGDLQRAKQAIESGSSEVVPIGAAIQEADRRRTSIRQRRETELRDFSERGQKLKDLQSRLQDVDDEMRRLMVTSQVGGLGTIADRCKELKIEANRIASEIETISQDLNVTTQEITEVTRSVDGQKAAERELNDSIMLIEKRVQLESIGKKKKELEGRLRQIVGPGKSVRDRQVELQRREAEFMREKIETDAHRSNLKEQLKANNDSLTGEFLNADKKYRDEKAKLKVTTMANEDLKSYYRLVDKALLTFHTRKMTEINRIIGEIWQHTYKGGDIDSIEIQSDVDTVGTTEATKRRIYNYRVVMKKGDALLDMRGRCSAGQKVLASIIIRLALSEAFAGKCHILALDEPTTNLDRDNISSLAHSLVKIIQMRAIRNNGGGSDNFQLLVITHDTDFIELLGRLSDFADQFYMLERDSHGETRIQRKSVGELVSATPG